MGMDLFLDRIAKRAGLTARALDQAAAECHEAGIEHLAVLLSRLADDQRSIVFDIHEPTPVSGLRASDKH